MAPQLSGSAFHRRRSLRDKAGNASVLAAIKENLPTAGTVHEPSFKTNVPPASSNYGSNSVLGAHNAIHQPTVRELFTTPQHPTQPRAASHRTASILASTTGWRSSPFGRRPSTSIRESVDVHAPRVLLAVFHASVVGVASLVFCTYFTRLILYPRYTVSFSWGAACCSIYFLSFCLFLLFLGTSEGIFAPEHPCVPVPYLNRSGLRYIGATRYRWIHMLTSACILATLVVSTSFCMGVVHRGILASALFPMWIGFFCGGVFSYLSQVTGFFTWRFSPTRETALRRVGQEWSFAVGLAIVSALSGYLVSALDLVVGRQVIRAFGYVPKSVLFSVKFSTQFAAFFSSLIALCSLSLVALAYMHMMTTAMSISEYIKEGGGDVLQMKSTEEKARGAVLRLLDDISVDGTKIGLPSLTRLLGFQFFRDVARTSRAGRRILFSDTNGEMWETMLASCLEPIKALTIQTSSADSSKSFETEFAQGRAAGWACETLSHFVVASRNEDDFGIAQRSFVHVVMNLLALKDSMDISRERMRIRRSNGTLNSNLTNMRSFLKPPPQNIYFAPETLSAVVGDAVDLALVRIVDSFRDHLEGFLVGAEPHWDRRFDSCLRAVLQSHGSAY